MNKTATNRGIMMPETRDFETDQMLSLLAEALRSGPGSPQWHEAIRMLRAQPPGVQADEYQLLCDARERLESGKSYRSIRAGNGFTRKLMQSMSKTGGEKRWFTPASLVLLLAMGVMLAVIAGVAVMIHQGGKSSDKAGAEGLNQIRFTTSVIPTTRFDTPPTTLPSGWRSVGTLPIIIRNGLKPGPMPPATEPSTALLDDRYLYRVGGIVSAASFPADLPIQMDLSFRVSKANDELWVQAFVCDHPLLSGAAEPHGIVCQIKQDEATVFLGGRAEAHGQKVPLNQEFSLRLTVDRAQAIIECNGQRLYAGPQPLDSAMPHYVGVRFVRQVDSKADRPDRPDRFESWVTLLSAGVQKP